MTAAPGLRIIFHALQFGRQPDTLQKAAEKTVEKGSTLIYEIQTRLLRYVYLNVK